MHYRWSFPKSTVTSVLLLVLGWTVCAEPCRAAKWVDVRVAGPFVIRADFPLAGFDELLKDLQQLQVDLNRSLGIQPPRERIELYLLSNERIYRAFLKRHFPGTPYAPALFYKSRGVSRVIVHKSPEFEVDIRHECTHALLHANLPVVPLWLDEGLAKYFEQPPEKRLYDHPYAKYLTWRLRFGMVASLEKLEKKDSFEAVSDDYRDSWAWAHYLLHGSPEARHELIRYLNDLRSHQPSKRFSERLAKRVPKAQSAMATHFYRWKRPSKRPRESGILGGVKLPWMR
jgi:hypothetical protein